jgi:NAD(P)-dependent dehydrogenase (short-subunit alcohol dehydrogenase family)
MKVLVTGGNRGLGEELVNAFDAVSLSRTNGYNIATSPKEIAELSLEYDVFINNAFDGPPQEEWANFGQVQVLLEAYKLWKAAGKDGYIFNVGSVGERTITAPEPSFETYRIAKGALAHASRQCTAAFKTDLIKFKTTLITPDRLDTELSRSRTSWTGNGINCTDIVNFIKYATSIQSNSVVEEIILYVNFSSK